MSMSAWPSPQNSKHCPRYVPGRSAWIQSAVVWPGTASFLPPRFGTQKEWMTSFALSSTFTFMPAGMLSSSPAMRYDPSGRRKVSCCG